MTDLRTNRYDAELKPFGDRAIVDAQLARVIAELRQRNGKLERHIEIGSPALWYARQPWRGNENRVGKPLIKE
jgi:hypothetical protein